MSNKTRIDYVVPSLKVGGPSTQLSMIVENSSKLFDVEIFFRMIRIYGRPEIQNHLREIPLKAWIDTADSRVRPLYFFKLWWDLFKISKEYRS